MRLSTRIKLAILLWLIAEIFAFSLVAHWIGVPRAILVGVITSLLGLSLLRRAGTSALLKLRARMDGRPLAAGDSRHFLDETLATAGALALLLPGFLSDIAGLALAMPAMRDRITRWVDRGGLQRFAKGRKTGPKQTGRAPQHGPATIDLAPEEWQQTDPNSRPISKV